MCVCVTFRSQQWQHIYVYIIETVNGQERNPIERIAFIRSEAATTGINLDM